MTFDADNRLTSFNGQVVSFDADGNMTQGPSAISLNPIAYSYDARNRLGSAGNASYNYNPDGRRTSLSDATLNPNGVSSTFVIDPNARLDRTLIRNKGGNITYYVYGLGLIGQEQNGAYQNYHFDSRGSTVALTDANGVVTDRFEYDSYGNSLTHTGTSDTPFQYNGRFGVQTDPNGILYMRARYYNPAIRRFVNQDVLFGNINPGISLNRYAYANGNPISLTDPFGLCAQSDDLGTRVRNLAGAWGDQVINLGIGALQWWMYAGGEATVAEGAEGLKNPMAQWGWYNPKSPIVKPAQSVVDNVVGDAFVLGGFGPEASAAEGTTALARSPDFIATENGTVFAVPKGATGPGPVASGKGFSFTGGSGGNGLNPNTTGLRLMDPVTTGPYQYPNGYGVYMNQAGRTVDPYTGLPIPRNDPFARIPVQ
jgi:RHS repeat-associated protein